MTDNTDDLLPEDELEPEGLGEDVTEADREARHALEDEEAELEVEEAEEGEGPVAGPLQAEEEEAEEAEASLDEILRERFEGEEEYEEEGPEARVVAPSEEEVRPRTTQEFVCQSCFLVKHRTQLADATRSLCRDCVNNART